MPLAAIALGSNLGDRRGHLTFALLKIAELPSTRILRISPVIETEPLRAPASAAAPPDPGGQYLNGAALLQTDLPARELLEHLLRIERERGRTRSPDNRWGERTLDLDLLLYADAIIDEPDLVVPHPRMHERRFVLEPLAEIGPDLVVPTLGQTVGTLLGKMMNEER